MKNQFKSLGSHSFSALQMATLKHLKEGWEILGKVYASKIQDIMYYSVALKRNYGEENQILEQIKESD